MTTQHDEAKGGTPRTDAVALHRVVYRKNGNEAEIGFSFARTLERELTAIQTHCAELERKDAIRDAYVKKLDGLIEEVGGCTFSCINPYEDLKASLIGLKKRAEDFEREAADLRRELDAVATTIEERTEGHTVVYSDRLRPHAKAIRALLATKEPDKGKE